MLTTGSDFRQEFENELVICLEQLADKDSLQMYVKPFSNYVNSQTSLLAFALARHSGAGSKRAFFCEWLTFSYHILANTGSLLSTNIDYLIEKQVLDSKNGTDNKRYVAKHILPPQIKLTNQVLNDLKNDFIARYPNIASILSRDVLHKVNEAYTISPEVSKHLGLEMEKLLDYLSYKNGYTDIVLPVLIGFMADFTKDGSPINVDKIDWKGIETVLKSISLFYLRSVEPNFSNYFDVKAESLDKTLSKILSDTTSQIDTLVLPGNKKEVLQNLLQWSASL